MNTIDMILSLFVIANLAVTFYIYQTVVRLVKLNHQYQSRLRDISKQTKVLMDADQFFKITHQKFQSSLDSLESRIESMEQGQRHKGAYHQASKMVEMGAKPTEVVSTCKISKAEANLLANLNAYKSILRKNSV